MESTSNQHYSFGELLRVYRKRRKLTQKQLARIVGVHYNTISAWELGSYLPETRGLILEVSRVLELDKQETHQILEASLTALSSHWHLPYLRNPFFTGREEILNLLHQWLQYEQPDILMPACVLHGLGGVGKTQVAVEYAYRHMQEYTAVFWIGAETIESIIASFQSIATLLGIQNQSNTDQRQIVAVVQRWLNIHRQWLLIWDNVEDIDLLSAFLPAAREGKHLFTTRRQALGAIGQRVELRPMTNAEGVLFLLRRTRLIAPNASAPSKEQMLKIDPSEYNAVQKLVVAMDGLPLALDQVGAYVEETPCSLVDYMRFYQTRQTELLQWRGETILDHPASIATTWSLAFEKIEQTNGAAADLLRLCAFLHPDAIPEEILVKGAHYLGDRLCSVAADPLRLNEALRTISAYSLLSRNTKCHTLVIHRLMQVVLRACMDGATVSQWMERTVDAVNAAYIGDEGGANWADRERYIPHAQACRLFIEQADMNRPEARSLLQKLGGYLLERGRYTDAVVLLEQVLVMIKARSQADDLELTAVFDNLAELYMYQGKYEQAGAFFRESLTIYETHFGPEHLRTSSGVISLGIFYRSQGKYEQAEGLLKRALAIRERHLGQEHRQTAQCFGSLAILYREQGKYEQAEVLFQRSLTVLERHLGSEHPLLAQCLGHLGILYGEQGKQEEAEIYLKRALAIREQYLGPDHPHTAQGLERLGTLYREQGRYRQAEPLLQKALAICEQQLAPENPEFARYFESLGSLYRDEGIYTQAEPLLQHALAMRERHFGPEHLSTALVLRSVALLYQAQNKNEQARALYRRVLTIYEQCLGKAHPKAIRARGDYERAFGSGLWSSSSAQTQKE